MVVAGGAVAGFLVGGDDGSSFRQAQEAAVVTDSRRAEAEGRLAARPPESRQRGS
jgi:hypothetical protein